LLPAALALQRPVADEHRAQPMKSRAEHSYISVRYQGLAWRGCRVRPRVQACSGPRRCSCGAVAGLHVTAGATRSQRRRTRGPVLPRTRSGHNAAKFSNPRIHGRHDGAYTSASSGPFCAFCSSMDCTTSYSMVCSRWSPSSTCSGGHGSSAELGGRHGISGGQILAS